MILYQKTTKMLLKKTFNRIILPKRMLAAVDFLGKIEYNNSRRSMRKEYTGYILLR